MPPPTVDQETQTVTLSWDNGNYGGVTINWGDDNPPETFNASEGEETHEYEVPPTQTETFTITVTATHHEGRTQSHDVIVTNTGP